MSRHIHRLTNRQVASAEPPKHRPAIMLNDGNNLYLRVSRSAAGDLNKSWVFRYELDGTRHDLGLGSLNVLNLVEARAKARSLKLQLLDGINPFEARLQVKTERLAKLATEARVMTFRECAIQCMASHENGWRNAEHRRQWTSTLETYVYPIIGGLPVDQVDTPHIVRVLEAIWKEKPETASRVRGRIEKVLGWATVRGFRSGDNPARWRGHLQELFAAKTKIQPVKHHKSLPYTEIGAFMSRLRGRDSLGARALEFAVLTATRSGEALGATWDEIDFGSKTWTIPASRMKAHKEHRVPLSDYAVKLLSSLPRTDARVFPIHKKSFAWVLDSLHVDATAHGFRSTFKTWASERTSYPREVSEMALAHAIPSAVERAYARSDLFEKRRKLMDAWTTWCARPIPTGATIHKIGAST